MVAGQVLCIQGFLACRSQADRIMLLVEMMAASGCPCFKAGARAVRFPAWCDFCVHLGVLSQVLACASG